MPKEESAIWKIGLFKRTEEGSNAVCLDCKEKERKKSVFSLNKGSTSGLIVHLKSFHSDSEYLNLFKKNSVDEEKGTMEKFVLQSGGKIILNYLAYFLIGGLSSAEKRVISYVCCNLTSFLSLNHKTTRAVFRDKLRDESHYRKTVLPKAYDAVKRKIMLELADSNFLSFTTDIWSGPTESFLSLTVHLIDSKWQKKHFPLCINSFPGSHTGKRISEQHQT
uniref:Uncharacterized protein n=1 Tax=Meloidogyne enterolobii TaxID=390850 RepID=A0A6V7Y5U0_MELEN|nr:unnamed protein product [Meloidogyne enterolobii]